MDAFKETVLMTQNVAREASKQGIEMGRRESAEKILLLTGALKLALLHIKTDQMAHRLISEGSEVTLANHLERIIAKASA